MFGIEDLRFYCAAGLDANPAAAAGTLQSTLKAMLAEYNDLLQKRKELRACLEEQEGMTDVFSESDAWSWAVTPFPWM